jgi:hypothetical protein
MPLSEKPNKSDITIAKILKCCKTTTILYTPGASNRLARQYISVCQQYYPAHPGQSNPRFFPEQQRIQVKSIQGDLSCKRKIQSDLLFYLCYSYQLHTGEL